MRSGLIALYEAKSWCGSNAVSFRPAPLFFCLRRREGGHIRSYEAPSGSQYASGATYPSGGECLARGLAVGTLSVAGGLTAGNIAFAKAGQLS